MESRVQEGGQTLEAFRPRTTMCSGGWHACASLTVQQPEQFQRRAGLRLRPWLMLMIWTGACGLWQLNRQVRWMTE